MDMTFVDCLDGAGATGGPASDDGGRAAGLRACLVENYARLHRRLRLQLGCADAASDCLHEAWLRLGDMALPHSVRCAEAYVYRVASNLAMDRLRGDRMWRHADDADDALHALADPAPGPEAVAEGRSEVRALLAALQRLPYRYQAVLAALRIEDMTRGEVARRHGMSPRRVDTLVRQAMAHCAAQGARP
ncbi:ECF sigma factor [Bordetella ansorpii]|uniref:ECF sigma factor n=1 Tax=Bordetella ansorpii TaxID=288768 RepID=A0A157S5N3_9BORD|nr:sigma-70 family RNA polymerase sigma factor [Bordetella ansorpii]SAI65712.1 ECF sigma factor [Bordetella ansorpii]